MSSGESPLLTDERFRGGEAGPFRGYSTARFLHANRRDMTAVRPSTGFMTLTIATVDALSEDPIINGRRTGVRATTL